MENYNIDKIQIYEQQESRAVAKVSELEERTTSTPLAFLKQNYSFIRLRDRKSEPEFGMLLGVTLAKICALAGIKSEIDSLIKHDLTKMIFYSYGDLTLEEIYKAFELERHGTYETKTEHFNLFNADYVSSILKKYKEWRQQMRRTHYLSPPKPTTEMEDSEKKQIIDNGIIRKFNEFKESKKIEDPFVYIFDELFDRKIIKGSDTPALAMYYQKKLEQANLEIVTELKNFTSADKAERNKIKDELEKILSGDSSKVQIRAKRIILTEFFNKLVLQGTEIETLLNP